MKKVNLILSFISLIVTSFLIVLMIFAWYATNKTARVTEAFGSTATDGYTITLERGTYNAGTWTWTSTTSLELSNLQPGDVYYFRFVISYENASRIQTQFSNINSRLTEDSVTLYTDNATNNKYVQIAGTNVNWLRVTGNEVIITESNNNQTTTSRLYSISGSTITLNTTAYNVADTFKFYNYGLGTSIFHQDATISATDNKEDSGTVGSGIVLTNLPQYPITYNLNTFTPEDSNNKVGYGYFALEFNDTLSLKNYLHIDNKYYEDSNLYQCQMLSIGSVAVQTLKD